MSPNNNSSFARMIGGVAGMMDSIESTSLHQGEKGLMGSKGSTQYKNQVTQLLASQLPQPQPIRNTIIPSQWTPTVTTPRPIQQTFNPTNTVDISKYIGQQKQEKPVQQQETDLVSQIKVALQPIYDQLEKLCVLTGLVYQTLNKETKVERQEVITKKIPVKEAEIDELSIEDLEKQIDAHKKDIPDASELIEDNEDEDTEEE